MKITLTKKQLTRLADITGNLGLVFFASVVIPYTLDRGEITIASWGLVFACLSWVSSLLIERNTK